MPCSLPAPARRSPTAGLRWASVKSYARATIAMREQSWKRADRFVKLLKAMDLNQDGKLSFSEWTHGVLAQPGLCHFLMDMDYRISFPRSSDGCEQPMMRATTGGAASSDGCEQRAATGARGACRCERRAATDASNGGCEQRQHISHMTDWGAAACRV
uniref:EF-hand domain-containing protein n=1 Tax=Calcidiscus leptoporus TaxID=127549 RepID=A0A7S0IMS5_9EUKA